MSDALSRLAAALVDRYRIERELGQGGMATVYLAEDLKHKRKVALKVLKPELAAVLGAERFVQEITTTAALQHPHILPLFDSGTADGFLYYVMPFIDGETLRAKLDRETQLGIDEAVTITTDVADALDYAHHQGVIHRDIKPENILLHDGRPMVADFGIALAVSAAAGGRMTETGLSLGTPHYMSPEQATAEKEITARSDVYSVGSVLYEMLTGNPPHTGASAQQIIMKIVTEEAAPVTTVRKAVPPNVTAAVAKALEKLPADRFESARAFADALGNSAFVTTASGLGTPAMATAHGVGPRRALLAAVALNAILVAVLLFDWMRPAPADSPSRQQVVLWRHPASNLLSPSSRRIESQAAIAPDGSSIVFSDSLGDGTQLMRKLRNESQPTPLPGTEGGASPFFSPDGRWVGYLTDAGRLRKVPIAGGSSITLADNGDELYALGAWLDDQTIVYLDDQMGLRRISADGGDSEVFLPTDPSGGFDPSTVWPLPGSRGILFTACPGNCASGSGVYLYDFVADSIRLLIDDAAGVWYAPTGHLLYGDREGGLFAVGFDPHRMEVTTGATPVINGVAPGSFTLSASGTALYTVGAKELAPSSLVWVARDGSEEQIDPEWQAVFEYPALSPDGMTLAVSVREEATQLWIRRPNGTKQQLTQGTTGTWRPSWTADGGSVTFVTTGAAEAVANDLYLSPADGGLPPRLILDHDVGVWEAEYSRDGEWLVVRVDDGAGGGMILTQRVRGDTSLVPLVVGGFNTQVALSPDGRWLAYASDVSGRTEVYVASFPDMNSTHLVSQGNGTEPRWAHSGRELFFKSNGRLMSISVALGPVFIPGVPRAMFSVTGYREAINRQQYDVAPDDQRFLMIRESGGGTPDEVVYVEHFLEELKAKVEQ